MIIDSVKNVFKYKNIPPEAAQFIEAVSSSDFAGHYDLSDNVFANIDEYETKPISNCKFEAHKKYIDVQMILEGEEEIDIIPVKGLNISEEYDEARDVMFFENPSKMPDKISLNPGKFVLIETYEAHKPQIAVNGVSKKVKKAVVKILL